MEKQITKEDMQLFWGHIISEIQKLLSQYPIRSQSTEADPEWIKSRRIRKLLYMSPGTLQNLRISGKIRFKKIQGSYYYNRADVQRLFKDK